MIATDEDVQLGSEVLRSHPQLKPKLVIPPVYIKDRYLLALDVTPQSSHPIKREQELILESSDGVMVGLTSPTKESIHLIWREMPITHNIPGM